MLDIAFDNLNYTEQELQAILSGIKKKSKYVKLKDNTIIELDTIASEQFEKTIEEFNLDSKKLKETQTKPLYQSLKIINDKDSLVRDFLSSIEGVGSTIIDASGGYSNDKQTLILAVAPTRMYFLIKEGLREIDKNIFYLVCDSYEVSSKEEEYE